jgi:hypothetical protein
MTDPERLLSGGTSFERGLLGAAAVERPNPALVARMEQGLGLSSVATASAISGKLLVAILGTGAAGGLAVWGLIATTSPEPIAPPTQGPQVVAVDDVAADAPPPQPGAAIVGVQAGDVHEVPQQAQVEDLPLVAADEVAKERKPATRRSRAASPSDVAPVSKSDQLKQEVQQLDRVRAALGAGDKARARQLLDGYDRKFPSGTLAPEAAKLSQSARD